MSGDCQYRKADMNYVSISIAFYSIPFAVAYVSVYMFCSGRVHVSACESSCYFSLSSPKHTHTLRCTTTEHIDSNMQNTHTQTHTHTPRGDEILSGLGHV